MINKLLSSVLLSGWLLSSSLYAGTKCEDCHDPVTKNAAALHYTVSKPNSQESKYWDDFLNSGNKDITVYVRDLSRKDAQAALWFITTGGKHGFAARQATAQERIYLEDAIKQVAISYSQQGFNSGKGLQEWSQVSTANHAGHLHLQMIYKQIDELKKDNADLKSKVSNLEREVDFLKISKKETDERLKLADQERKKLDTKIDNIYEKLSQESASRRGDIERLSKEIEARVIANNKESNNNWASSINIIVKDSEARIERIIRENQDKLENLKVQLETQKIEMEKQSLKQDLESQKGKKKKYKDLVKKQEKDNFVERERQKDEEIKRLKALLEAKNIEPLETVSTPLSPDLKVKNPNAN